MNYEWKMFYHNHMRTTHQTKAVKPVRRLLSRSQKDFLENYFDTVCPHPNLDEIKGLAQSIDARKESVYWWFFNQRKRKFPNRITCKTKVCRGGRTKKSKKEPTDTETQP